MNETLIIGKNQYAKCVYTNLSGKHCEVLVQNHQDAPMSVRCLNIGVEMVLVVDSDYMGEKKTRRKSYSGKVVSFDCWENP